MSSSDQLAMLALSQRNRLESFLMEFESAWHPDRLDDYCGRLESEESQVYRQLAISELVKIDLQRRWSSGQGQLLEDYFQQIPKLGTPESVDADLILAEYEARRTVEADLDLASYATRFPKQFARLSRLAAGQSPVQASVETSRVGNAQDTLAPQQGPPVGIPEEFGRYRILRELGSGAMGIVYLAHDTQLDRQVALKTPSFGGGADQQLVTRFYREARAAAKIQHRNICPVYDVGEIDGTHFISMAFVKGRSMSEYIAPDKLPPQKTSAILVHRIAMALAEAHRHNIVHRDLKPANIIIDLKREPVVMDFGLARQTDVESRMTQTGMIVGTPAFMSPEQLKGKTEDLGPSVDIYSLGVILYELLTGKLPFRGAIAQVIYQIINEEPTPPSEIRSGVDSELESICAKMMAKSREVRFQTMDEAAVALKDYVKGIKPNKSTDAETEKQTGTTDSPRSTGKSKQLGSKGFSETGALNAFFAAQADANPQQTSLEPLQADKSVPSATPVPLEEPQPGLLKSEPMALATGVDETNVGSTNAGSLTPAVSAVGSRDRPFSSGQLRLPRNRKSVSGFANGFTGNRKWIAIGLGGGAALLLLALGVFLIRTPYGTIRIETFGDLEGLEVQVDGNTISLTESAKTRATDHDLAIKLNGAELRLDPASNEFVMTRNGTEYRLSVTIGDLELSSKSFTVIRNKETVLKIELLANDAVVSNADKVDRDEANRDEANRDEARRSSASTAVEGGDPSAARIALEFVGKRARRSHGPRWLAYAPDGRAFASGGKDGVIHIWNSRVNEVLATLQGHGEPVKMVAYSPDGKQLASCSADNTVRFWDVVSQQQIRQIDAPSVIAIAYSAGGDTLAWAGGDGNVRLIDVATGSERKLIDAHDAKTVSVAFSRDGRTLATASTDRTIKLWDATNNYRHQATLRGHEKAVIYVTFSPDSKTLASTGVDKTIKLWDVETGKRKLSILTRSAWVFSVSFSPDGDVVAAGGVRRTIGLWSAQTGELLYETPQGKNNILVSTFSPDGKSIVASRTDFWIGVWDVTRIEPEVEPRANEPAMVAVSPRSTRDAISKPEAELISEGNALSPSEVLTSENWQWSEPVNLGRRINSRFREYGPCLSGDGLTLLWGCQRKTDGKWKKPGPWNEDIWQAVRLNTNSPWGKATQLKGINTTDQEATPELSTDGLTLFFSSDRPGGQGRHDLWRVRRATVDAAWGKPVNVGAAVNSPGKEIAPDLSYDGLTLLFDSDREGGQGGHDLWMCTRSTVDGPWSSPINLGPNVNSAEGEHNPIVSSGGKVLMYVRGGNIWIASRDGATEPFGKSARLPGPTGLNWESGVSDPFLTRDAQTLYFASGRKPTHGGPQDIWVCNRLPRVGDANRVDNDDSAAGGAVQSWVDLLNGRDLTGWKVVGARKWKVQKGVLIGNGQKNDGGWLMSDAEYENFEMELEYKLSTGGNSGVFFRAWPEGKKSGGDFHEIQLLDDSAPRYANVNDTGRNGALYGQIAAKPDLHLAPNQWHRMRISVVDDRAQVWINDQKIVDGKIPAGKKGRGQVGIQLHQSLVEFRNIRIRDLRLLEYDVTTPAESK